MPEVVTDTSPLQYLYQTNLLELLPILYGQILIPQAVADELAQGRLQGVALPEPSSLPWVSLRQIRELDPALALPNLGLGEREALTLAMALPNSLVILDDALARRYARELNVSFTGTLGVLLRAKQAGHLDTIAPVLDQLNALSFRLAPATRIATLRLANEGP